VIARIIQAIVAQQTVCVIRTCHSISLQQLVMSWNTRPLIASVQRLLLIIFMVVQASTPLHGESVQFSSVIEN